MRRPDPRQPSFFDDADTAAGVGAYGQPAEVGTRFNGTVHPDAMPRLGSQQRAILEMFRAAPGGRLTNMQLAEVSHRFGGRLHELIHKYGFDIRKVIVDHRTGLVVYQLFEGEAS